MLALYTITIFQGAMLLFMVQPMFARLVLPLLGGAPAVWNTCLVFFQAVLLAGYAYAHASTRWLGARRQAAWHCILLLLPLAVLPLGVPEGWHPPTEGQPIAWLLALLSVSVGGPFFVVSSTAPVVQKWFAEAGHRASADPYFLYGASNLGSMLGLVSFPLVIEPNLRLAEQAWLWAAGYGALVAMTALCAIVLWRAPRRATSAAAPPGTRGARAAESRAGLSRSQQPASAHLTQVTLKRRWRWLALSFVPSSWLLGVTTHLTTDIAPVPLLWIIPLATYLLTFILVFARRPPLPQAWLARLFPVTTLLLAVSVLVPGTWPVLLLHLAAFFVGAMVCHGELARDRPPTTHLTEFYLWLSAGGVLGGAFNALLAPLVFPCLLEYPLAVVAACLLCPPVRASGAGASERWLKLGLLAGTSLLVGLLAGKLATERPVGLAILVVAVVPLLLVLYVANRPWWFALAVALPLMADKLAPPFAGEVLFRGRSYFGVHSVIAKEDAKYRYHYLLHGVTIHGRQCRHPARRCQPLTYYHPTGPLGSVFQVFGGGGSQQRIAVVGLGSGAMACYAAPGRRFVFYEIDPLVQHLAETPDYFSYLSGCARGEYEIVLGDGRLKLAEAPDGSYDLMILDAFSSDAVPVHMLTREALELYRAKLTGDGVLVFHVTNSYLNLEAVLGDLAADAHLVCLAARDWQISRQEYDEGKTPSTYVVMARRPADLEGLAGDRHWLEVRPRPGAAPWTDGFSDIISVLRW